MTEPTEGAAVTATPARDALDKRTAEVAIEYATKSGCCADASWRGHMCQFHQGVEEGMDLLLEAVDSGLVVAALVESGWKPTAAQLEAMGGRPGRRVVAVGTLGTFWQFEGVDGDL